MAKINKVGEHKVDDYALEDYPMVICEQCGDETTLKTVYQDVRTQIDSEEMDLIRLDFEENHRSSCCGELVFLVNDKDEEIHDDDVYTYIEY